MKFLADENFPPTLISYLQKKRYNIKRIQRGVKLSDLYVAELADLKRKKRKFFAAYSKEGVELRK